MATVKTIISSAWRRSSVVAAGRDPSAALVATGLERLQNLYDTIAAGTLGRMNDVFLAAGTDAYTANEWDRVYCTDAIAVVTLPPNLTDANSGQQRTPLDYAPIHVVHPSADPPTAVTSVWDAFIGNWAPLQGIGLDGYAPFSGRHMDGLASALALLLGDEAGYNPRVSVVKMAATFRMNLASRWDQKRESLKGVYY